MTDFSLRYFQPAAILRDWVSTYYMFECDIPAWTDNLCAEPPQVRFMWQGDVQVSLGGLPELTLPRASLAGPTSAAIRFDVRGSVRMFGAGLLPAGWAALIGIDANEYANLPIDLEEVTGHTARYALHQLAEAESDRERITILDVFFLSLAARERSTPLWFTRATDAWLTGSSNPDVNHLVDALGMSSRQIERLALRIYGASPKFLARKSRAMQAAVRLGHNPEEGWENAADGAYYDQAHFIRDFKNFIGMTPGEYVKRGEESLIRITVNEP